MRFKARLVAQGNRQIEGQDYDQTYAPVVNPIVVRIILAISVINAYSILFITLITLILLSH